MGLNASKSALAEIVGGRQAEVLYPKEIVPAVFGNTFKHLLQMLQFSSRTGGLGEMQELQRTEPIQTKLLSV